MANGMVGAVLGIFAAAVSRRGWVYFGTYDGRWMGSDGTFVSMFPCRVMILGYIGIVGTLEKIDSTGPGLARLPSSTPTYAVLV